LPEKVGNILGRQVTTFGSNGENSPNDNQQDGDDISLDILSKLFVKLGEIHGITS
jgi:hypothetical protein